MKNTEIKRNKGKELIAVFTVCILSIVLFSVAFIALNGQIFAAATSEPTLLEQSPAAAVPEISEPAEEDTLSQYHVATTDYTDTGAEYAGEAGEFVVPALIVTGFPEQESEIPAVAMSMEEAAQTGARYIWDVFGSSIDGMHVRMFFGDHASQMNNWWVGNVFAENPDYPTQNYFVNPSTNERFIHPTYTFVVNAITGQRVDISYEDPQGVATVMTYRGVEDVMIDRRALAESGWFDMDIYEKIEFLGISDEALESYLQTAKRLAETQFNTTDVSDVRLDAFWANGMIDGVVDLATIVFVALDNTGREAIIAFPASDAVVQSINVSTQHNDFVPGFVVYDDGSGVG